MSEQSARPGENLFDGGDPQILIGVLDLTGRLTHYAVNVEVLNEDKLQACRDWRLCKGYPVLRTKPFRADHRRNGDVVASICRWDATEVSDHDIETMVIEMFLRIRKEEGQDEDATGEVGVNQCVCM